jgi:predicted membrane-bound mannosyltransferase
LRCDVLGSVRVTDVLAGLAAVFCANLIRVSTLGSPVNFVTQSLLSESLNYHIKTQISKKTERLE